MQIKYWDFPYVHLRYWRAAFSFLSGLHTHPRWIRQWLWMSGLSFNLCFISTWTGLLTCCCDQVCLVLLWLFFLALLKYQLAPFLLPPKPPESQPHHHKRVSMQKVRRLQGQVGVWCSSPPWHSPRPICSRGNIRATQHVTEESQCSGDTENV